MRSLIAHRQAGGILRDQSDGVELEGGQARAIALRLFFLVGSLGGMVLWLVAPDVLPASVSLPPAVHWIGLGLAVGGLLLLIAVHLTLGVHFSGTLHLRDDHQLVTSGPYGSIRHPMYSSFLLLFGGLSVLMSNVIPAAVILGSQVWVLGVRLPREEEQSVELGPAWNDHRAATGALLPSGRRR